MAKAGTVKDKTWGSLGGSGHMYGWRGTGEQEPGQVAQEGTGSKRGIAPKAGGSDVGYYSDNTKSGKTGGAKYGTNTDYAGPATAGGSGPTKEGGDKHGFAKGGSTNMFGNRGSQRAEAGKSSP